MVLSLFDLYVCAAVFWCSAASCAVPSEGAGCWLGLCGVGGLREVHVLGTARRFERLHLELHERRDVPDLRRSSTNIANTLPTGSLKTNPQPKFGVRPPDADLRQAASLPVVGRYNSIAGHRSQITMFAATVRL
jgi:hypothetical protein